MRERKRERESETKEPYAGQRGPILRAGNSDVRSSVRELQGWQRSR